MKTVWIPEAPDHLGLYANENGTDIKGEGKFTIAGRQPSTMSAHHAKHFFSIEECQAWCDANPTPKFVPKAHEFKE